MYRIWLVFIALLHLYACKDASRPRSVNLALDTVLEFNNNDNSADIQIIDKVKKFLNRIKSVIDTNKYTRRSLASKRLKFTDFLKKTVVIFKSYDDDDLEYLISVIDDEIRKYHYKGCKFYELVENYNVRRFMAHKLEEVKVASAKSIKQMMSDILEALSENNLDVKQKSFLNYVNSLYDGESEHKLRKFLEKLTSHKAKSKRSHTNLIKIVRNGIRSIIFDHYSNLDFKTRKDFKGKLEMFWKDYTNPERAQHHEWKYETSNKGDLEEIKIKENSFSSESAEKSSMKESELLIQNKSRHQKKKKQIKKHKIQKDSKSYKPAVESAARHEYDTEISLNVNRDDSVESSTKKHLTFITLYPEEITLKPLTKNTKAFQRARVQTLWEEKEERIKSKSHRKPTRTIVAEHETVISVKKEHVRSLDRSEFDMVTRTENRPLKRSWDDEKKTPKRPKTPKRHSKHQYFGRSRKTVTKSKILLKPTPAIESHEGLRIESYELEKKSLRKSNMNDSLPIANSTVSYDNADIQLAITPDANVIKRLSNLEKELKVVKDQMHIKPDYAEIPHYGKLEFWKGTKKDEREETTQAYVIQTTKSNQTTITEKVTEPTTAKTTQTSTLKTTQTSTPKTTKKSSTKTTKKTTTVKSTGQPTTTSKIWNNTYYPVFRSNNISDVYDKKPTTKKHEVKPLEVKVQEKKGLDINPVKKLTNFTGGMQMLNEVNNDIFNYSANIEDDINDIINPLDNLDNVNITSHISNLEKYINSTKAVKEDERHVVRKKMLEELKSIMSEKPEDEAFTVKSSTVQNMPTDDKFSSDPLNFENDAEFLK